MASTAVKICCIQSVEDAQMAMQAGATALGLVGPMPSGPGVISIEEIGHITTIVGDQVDTFLLTSALKADEIFAQHKIAKTNTIQLVDAIDSREREELRRLCPNVRLVQVIHVLDDRDLALAHSTSEHVDAILLDSGNPHLDIKQLGGTGKTHNWDISKSIVESVTVPVYLAGGLNSGNVARAIDYVRPYGVDLCSGVRSKGQLDPEKLFDFFTSVNTARN